MPPVTVVALNVGADVHQTDVLDATCAYTARLGVPCARSNEVSQRLPSNAAADVGTGAAPPPVPPRPAAVLHQLHPRLVQLRAFVRPTLHH